MLGFFETVYCFRSIFTFVWVCKLVTARLTLTLTLTAAATVGNEGPSELNCGWCLVRGYGLAMYIYIYIGVFRYIYIWRLHVSFRLFRRA